MSLLQTSPVLLNQVQPHLQVTTVTKTRLQESLSYLVQSRWEVYFDANEKVGDVLGSWRQRQVQEGVLFLVSHEIVLNTEVSELVYGKTSDLWLLLLFVYLVDVRVLIEALVDLIEIE